MDVDLEAFTSFQGVVLIGIAKKGVRGGFQSDYVRLMTCGTYMDRLFCLQRIDSSNGGGFQPTLQFIWKLTARSACRVNCNMPETSLGDLLILKSESTQHFKTSSINTFGFQ